MTAADLCRISLEARLRAYTQLAALSAEASALAEAAEQADTVPCPPPAFEPEPPEDPDYA